MKTPRISEAFGNIPEDLISEAVTYKGASKKKSFIKWGAIAACLCLIVTSGFFGYLFSSPDSSPDTLNNENNIMSFFMITAHAANGESTDLSFADSCLNSSVGGSNIFGVDMPLFNFSVRPTDFEGNEALYERFDISVSYNGIPVTDKIEHILIGYNISIPPSNEPWSWSISGWFTEPTDIIVNILDKESHEIVETITVNVNYLADKQEYELKVTNLTTKFPEQQGS